MRAVHLYPSCLIFINSLLHLYCGRRPAQHSTFYKHNVSTVHENNYEICTPPGFFLDILFSLVWTHSKSILHHLPAVYFSTNSFCGQFFASSVHFVVTHTTSSNEQKKRFFFPVSAQSHNILHRFVSN